MIEAGTSPLFSWPLRVTKQQWRTVVISTGGSGLQRHSRPGTSAAKPDHFARAGTSFIAKQLCSSVLMAGMDPDQVLKKTWPPARG